VPLQVAVAAWEGILSENQTVQVRKRTVLYATF
jgi:hypothetical protein